MEADALDRIVNLVRATCEPTTIDGVEYVPCTMIDPRQPDPVADTLRVNSLTGLVDYLKSPLAEEREPSVLHVLNPETVELVSGVQGRFRRREVLLRASIDHLTKFHFGEYLSTEWFVVLLMTRFVQTEELAKVLTLVGNLADDEVKTIVDDGVTQTVTVRAGITRVGEVEVPNPVTLVPFRTFREIEQPASSFLLRMRKGKVLPDCALFEADGQQWQLEAVQRIAAWLRLKLADFTVIA